MSQNPKERKTVAAQAPTQEVPTATVKVTKREQKKEELAPEYQVDSWVDALWESYSDSLSQTFKFFEKNEDAYLLAVKEANKWNGGLRSRLSDLQDLLRPNNSALNVFTNVFSYWKKEDDPVQAKLDEFDRLLQDITKKWTELIWNPWKIAVEFSEAAEKRFEENSAELVNSLREQRKIFASLSDQYVSYSKNNHRSFLRSVEDRLRPLVAD